jgi:hypothetical protein
VTFSFRQAACLVKDLASIVPTSWLIDRDTNPFPEYVIVVIKIYQLEDLIPRKAIAARIEEIQVYRSGKPGIACFYSRNLLGNLHPRDERKTCTTWVLRQISTIANRNK